MADERIVRGSGNVYADAGFEDPTLERAKAKIARAIVAAIRDRGMSQRKAADILGTDQPKISAISRGQLKGFSLERLISYARMLDRDVDILIGPSPSGRRAARVSVAVASDPLVRMVAVRPHSTAVHPAEARKKARRRTHAEPSSQTSRSAPRRQKAHQSS